MSDLASIRVLGSVLQNAALPGLEVDEKSERRSWHRCWKPNVADVKRFVDAELTGAITRSFLMHSVVITGEEGRQAVHPVPDVFLA
ncbi:hypothetical protein E4U54_000016 [Claviceps lovelessii]|nr:hypothetical protein E4U54_000016 [Claviceps lovelessii]